MAKTTTMTSTYATPTSHIKTEGQLNATIDRMGKQTTDRKLFLAAAAMCQAWGDFTSKPALAALENLIAFADGQITRKEFEQFCQSWNYPRLGQDDYIARRVLDSDIVVAGQLVILNRGPVWHPIQGNIRGVRMLQNTVTALVHTEYGDSRPSPPAPIFELVDVLDHVIPLGPHICHSEVPFSYTEHQLANALYHGTDCWFALHDALEEAGHPELSTHFQDSFHPKGCWILDLILGKQ